MKVSITLELDDDQRVAVGLIETGKFVPAKREQVREFVTGLVMAAINDTARVVVEQQKATANEIRKSLGKPEVAEF